MKIRFIILILISSICLNTTANPFKNLGKFRQQLQALYRLKKANPVAFSAFRDKYRNSYNHGNQDSHYSYNPNFRPLFAMSAAPLIAAIQQKDKEDQEKQEWYKKYLKNLKFFQKQLQTLNEDYKLDKKIQLIEVTLIPLNKSELPLTFIDERNEIHDECQVTTRTIKCKKYKLRVSIQVVECNPKVSISEQVWQELFFTLGTLDPAFTPVIT